MHLVDLKNVVYQKVLKELIEPISLHREAYFTEQQNKTAKSLESFILINKQFSIIAQTEQVHCVITRIFLCRTDVNMKKTQWYKLVNSPITQSFFLPSWCLESR